MTTIAVPRIHLNGTSKNALMEDYLTAYRKLTEAAKALQEAAPNARDYYPQGSDVYTQAASEHTARLVKIRSILDDLDTICNAISDQGRA